MWIRSHEIYVRVSDLHTREKPIGIRAPKAAYVRAPVGQDIAHGAPFLSGWEGVGGIYFVLVLLYLRYPLSIYPSRLHVCLPFSM